MNFEEKCQFDLKYKVGDKLGEGMHSEVKQCFLKDGDDKSSPLAVKITREDDEEKKMLIEAEFTIARELNHPNLVKIHDYFENSFSGEQYLVMDKFEGKELQ